MSVRTNPEKAVPLLLKGLADAIQKINVNEDDPLLKKINKIGCDLNAMEHIFPEVKHYEQDLLNYFANLKRSLRTLRNYDSRNIDSWLDAVDAQITNIKNTVSLLQQVYIPEPATPDRKFGRKYDRGPRDRRGLSELEERILTDPAMVNFQVSYDILDRIELKMCLLFLAIFPENSVIMKRPLIYWWIGEGLVKTEDDGEWVFEELLKRDLIKPHFNGKNPIVSKCEIHPWIRYMLISVAKQAQLFDFDSNGLPIFHNYSNNLSKRACIVLGGGISLSENNASLYENLWTIFNVNENYIDFSAGWLANLKKLRVLQLGRWQVLHKHHIEVQSEAFLKDLRTQKFLKYLSFRGISRITILPPSIVELVNLEILDLKDCHNLETLPADIEPLRKLTHLDVSGCYLLESMPKGLEKLTSLQVLKGFVIGNSKKTPCRIGDLKSLKKLKRLSIHIGSEAVIKDGEFEKLKDLEHVKCLKISWGVVSQKLKEKVMNQSFSFPASLEKLDLEGIPHEGVPDWLKPSKLKGLKELYIKGGKLNSLEAQGESNVWRSVEILCLKYLKNLNIELPKVREMFPNLRYVLKRGGEEVTRQVRVSEIREEVKDFEWCKEALEVSLRGVTKIRSFHVNHRH